MQILTAVQSYLQAQGYNHIYRDYMPAANAQLQAINLTQWDHTVGQINDGTGIRYIQIQCRDVSYDAAYVTCARIFGLLDSGPDERLIDLTADVYCVARPRRGPLILERGSGYTTIYCEVALWTAN